MVVPQRVRVHRALIVEDDPSGQQRLHALLQSVAEGAMDVIIAGDLATARTAVDADDFDIALIDIGLPDGSGIELITWLHAHCPRVTALVVTSWGDEETVLAALRAGAVGYLLKDRDDAELALALQNVQRGGAPIDPFVARRILALLPVAAPAPAEPAPAVVDLSGRECEILKLAAHGHNNRQIAQATGLSRFTIEDYTKRIYRKLAVGSRTEAVFKAQSRGLLR